MNSNTIFALDIGTRSIIGVVAEFVDEKIKIKAQHRLEHASRAMYDGQIHNIPKVAEGVAKVKAALEKKIGHSLHKVAIAAAGRSLKTRRCRVEQEVEDVEIDSDMIRSLEITGLQKAHRELNEELDGRDRFYCVGHTVVSYYLNNYPIANLEGQRGQSIGAEILATFLPDSVVNSLYSVLQRVDLEPISLTLEPIAAIDIAIPEDVRTLNLALVDIGAGTSDIAITSDGSITAYGMVPMAGDEITEAIVENCLVDFKTAENIKRELGKGKDINYVDILGMKNTISCPDVIAVIEPVLDQLADKITAEIIRLNGNKAPKTVFCIGGGSQVPLLDEKIARRLQLPKLRVAVRGRQMLNSVIKVKKDPIDGPDGVTVLGIASVAFKNVGHDFITINVNGKNYRLFNSSQLTVANALALIDYNPRELIARNGKNLTFTLNGEKKQIYGELGTPAQITVNGQPANMQTVIKDKDCVEIIKAVHGADASLTLGELLNSQGFDMEKCRVTVNGVTQKAGYLIQNGDAVTINDTGKVTGEKPEENKQNTAPKAEPHGGFPEKKWISVFVNGEKVQLKGKDNPVFVDIFNFIDFDLNNSKGMIVLKVNGEKAEYTQPLLEGDRIEIYWE
ncbi:cell division protein FtsA [Desulfohalotomaculum tongense]|uniref:cell division protein FtsA n=1 Tax=Desulforadius tongensis TaxID=1216062 RepID=UPI00195840CD|nr:cell division FtsA domain-containing protein [Desulforadius tongensis]MBM7855553.1 cell division protein FtsA [Desulforadius tongensis]